MNEVVPYLLNGGVAGGVLVLFAAGLIVPRSALAEKNEEIRELKQALALERQRGDASVTAAAVTRDVLMAFRGGAHEIAQAQENERHSSRQG